MLANSFITTQEAVFYQPNGFIEPKVTIRKIYEV